MTSSLLCALAGLSILFTGACKDDSSATSSSPSTASQTANLDTPKQRSEITITDGAGAKVYGLLPSDSGYKVKDASNTKVGKIKISDDRVKFKDASGTTLAKVKRKEKGFKLSANDATVFKAKVKPNKTTLKKGDGSVLAVFHGGAATVGSEEIKTLSGGETGSWRVERAGKPVAVVKGVSQSAAVYMGLTSLTLQQRIAVMIYVNDK